MVRHAADSLSGKLRVSAEVTFAWLHLLPSRDSFLSRHPKLEVDLAPDDRNIDLLEVAMTCPCARWQIQQ